MAIDEAIKYSETRTILKTRDGLLCKIKFGAYANKNASTDTHYGYYLEFMDEFYKQLYRKDLIYWLNKGLEIA